MSSIVILVSANMKGVVSTSDYFCLQFTSIVFGGLKIKRIDDELLVDIIWWIFWPHLIPTWSCKDPHRFIDDIHETSWNTGIPHRHVCKHCWACSLKLPRTVARCWHLPERLRYFSWRPVPWSAWPRLAFGVSEDWLKPKGCSSFPSKLQFLGIVYPRRLPQRSQFRYFY